MWPFTLTFVVVLILALSCECEKNPHGNAFSRMRRSITAESIQTKSYMYIDSMGGLRDIFETVSKLIQVFWRGGVRNLAFPVLSFNTIYALLFIFYHCICVCVYFCTLSTILIIIIIGVIQWIL